MPGDSTGDELSKVNHRLSLLRAEYTRLQKRCAEAEQENAVLSAGQRTGHSKDGFVHKLIHATAKLYNNQQYSDMIVRLGDGSSIHCHKFVLSIRNSSWITEDSTLDWTDLDPKVAHTIAKWVYTNKVELDEDLEDRDGFVLSLMSKGKEFKLPELMEACQETLLASVQVNNCIRYYTTAEEIGASILQDHCSELISIHWDDFTSGDFAHMSAPLMYRMFKEKTKHPLHAAIKLKREDVVFLYLIEFGSSLQSRLNECDEKGQLPLDLALSTAQTGLAQTLVDHKCNVNQLDSTTGDTILHKAINRGDSGAALFLLGHGSDPNLSNWVDHDTPLHLVAKCGTESMSGGMSQVAAKLIEMGAKPGAQNKLLETPLHLALSHANRKVFDLILESPSSLDLDSKNSEGHPPLWLALRSFEGTDDSSSNPFSDEPSAGSKVLEEMAESLVAKGASVNIVCDMDDNTLLHLCASNGLESAANFVLSHCSGSGHNSTKVANVSHLCDVTNSKGDTPLHSAARGGLSRVARTLLDKGADPNVQSHTRQSPAHIAASNQDIDFIRTLLQSPSLNSSSDSSVNVKRLDLGLRDSEGETAFDLALRTQNYTIATELLQGGADLNDTSTGRTPLHSSVSAGDLQTTRFLLEAGCDLNLRDEKYRTCLEVAIQARSEPLVEELCKFGSDMSLSSGADPPLWLALCPDDEDDASQGTRWDDLGTVLVRHGVNTDGWSDTGPDGCGQTLLHRAIDENREEVACFLVRAGCDLNSPRRPGSNGQGGEEAHDMATPLHLCCMFGLQQVVETLLEHGSSLNGRDAEGKTPLHLAVESGNEEIVTSLLQQNGLDLTARDKAGLTAFASAMNFKNQKAARRILQLEPSAADVLDTKGRNFLHSAILKDDLESVLFLLSVNANVHSKTQDTNKLSPLLLAVSKGNEMIVRNLLLAGASVDDVNPSGQTALQIAAENGLSEIASVLLSNGVDWSAADSRGNNALHLAVKEGHLEVARVLLTESQVDAEATNLKGRNPLHVLANFGHKGDTSVPIFLLFMECMPQYPINRPDSEGNTALLLAYMKGNGALCRSLITSGAVLGTLNNQGISIFNCQVASKQLLFRLLDFLSCEPKWGEGEVCQECSNKFGITNRKHHCRHCGRLLCNKCSSKEMPILKFDLSKPVRVCETCSDVLTVGVPPS